MIVNLIKINQMFSFTLPFKVKGQYWISDVDSNGKVRQFAKVEAFDGKWVIKSNKKFRVYNSDGSSIDGIHLSNNSFLNLKIGDSDEKMILFSEDVDESRQTLTKIMVREPGVFTIGRNSGNDFCYDYKFVSSDHARLAFDGERWSIEDLNSKNGIYLNGYRIHSESLKAGDYLYIMGLKIVIGSNYIAVNNPDGKLKVHSENLALLKKQEFKETKEEVEIPEPDFFLRSPRFHREIENKEIKIDPPPQMQKADTVPMALMLGPSLTMGMTSMITGITSVTSVISSGGAISQALPTLLTSMGMLAGTVLWPIITKRYEKKQKIVNEHKRQQKYTDYLDGIGAYVKNIAKEQSEILHENLITETECIDRIVKKKHSLWERVLGQNDFLRLRLGTGNIDMDVKMIYPEKKFTMDDDGLQDKMLTLAESPKVLKQVPISLNLTDNRAVGFYGAKIDTYNMLKSLVIQMISLHSYDELKIMLLIDENDEEKWSFAKYVPHFWNDSKTFRFFASTDFDAKEISVYLDDNVLSRKDDNNSSDSPYYVIISANKNLSKKCDALSSLLKYKNNAGFSLIYVGENFNDFPKETKTIVHINGNNSRMFDREDTTGTQIEFNAETSNNQSLGSVTYKIANTVLDLTNQNYILPEMVTFLEMFNVGKVEHLNVLARWKENNPTNTLQTPVGINEDGDIFTLDLHEKFHGPHGLVAGMTGSGKSEFIITYILSLAVNYHPDEVAFILIDYKGGGLAGAFEDEEQGIKLPHLAGTITNLDGASIKRSLISIQSELRRRQSIFNEARKLSKEGTMDIYKYQRLYREHVVSEPLPHLFIISDEFAELKTQQPEFMEQLISAARIGRSLGVHLILATQKPSGVIDDQIWSNSKFRVCLKVQEQSDSQDMIKCPDAASLSQTGRFYLQVGYNELFALGQSAWCGADYIPSDTVEKKKDNSVQVINNTGRVLMKVAHNEKQLSTGKKVKQLVSIVNYLSDLANEEEIKVRSLWLPPIPEYIYVDELEKKYGNKSEGTYLEPIIGEYDDPFNQKQNVLTLPISKDGNCLVYGSSGMGKSTFLTALCYSLLKNHTPEELNLYILDFASETLKAFANAPQVGGVVTSSEEEKTTNLIKMLRTEMEKRKALFSNYGGDYENYCKKGRKVSNIVVVINNYSGFAELYENLVDSLHLLTRDGTKYGIYFVVTASGTTSVSYKHLQNFKTQLTLQLNDATDYSIVVGKTDGVVPAKYKGRGLVAFDKVYEFQTARCTVIENSFEFIRTFCEKLRKSASGFAKNIPVLPNVVDVDFVRNGLKGLESVPVGVEKSSLNISVMNLSNKAVFPICSQDVTEIAPFAEELAKLISLEKKTYVFDAEKLLNKENELLIKDKPDEFVRGVFDDMVARNNAYVDGQKDESVLEAFEEKVYFIVGFKSLCAKLTEDSRDKLNVLLDNALSVYKLRFIVCDTASQLSSFNMNSWYKKQVTGTDGIWIGDGISDQYVIKISKMSRDYYEEIGNKYGYLVSKGKAVLVKLLTSDKEEF